MDEPDDHDGGDAAAEAFEGLRGEVGEVRGEVALLRRAVERLAAERAEVPEPPDYSETLGQIAQAAGVTARRVDVLAKAAEDAVAPRYVADRIVAAGANARDEDRRLLVTARAGLEDATRTLHAYVVSGRTGDDQNRWLAWTAIGGLIVGIVLWALFEGPILRATPDSWHRPERAAARILGGSAWDGARRLAAASNPDAWNDMVTGAIIGRGNQATIERCQRDAAKAGRPVRCTVSIGPGERR